MAAEHGDKPSSGLIALLGKALTDKDLRTKLFADPDATERCRQAATAVRMETTPCHAP